MNRRSFVAAFAPLAIAAVAVAKDAEKKADRLSGYVESVDRNAKTITMHTKANTNVKRKIMWDDKTQVITMDKPGTVADIKDGMRIVAVGTFQNLDLMATKISLTAAK